MKMKLTITTPSYMNTSSAGLKLPPAWLKSVNAKGIQLLQNQLFVIAKTQSECESFATLLTTLTGV